MLVGKVLELVYATENGAGLYIVYTIIGRRGILDFIPIPIAIGTI